MCFSATASFTAAAVLAVLGAALLFRIRDRRFLPLALIPIFFALQQAAEGFLWLDFSENAFEKDLFLFFAFVVWPLWIPYSFWSAETKLGCRQRLAVCFGIGLVVSCLLAFSIPYTTATAGHYSIHYSYPSYFDLHPTLFTFYAAATVLPFFLSSLRGTALLGILFALTALLIGWIDRIFFISLWCFVSALVSLGLFLILKPKFGR